MKTRLKTEKQEKHQYLKEEVEKAVGMLKNAKSPGVDNIPAEVLNDGGPGVTHALTVICQTRSSPQR